MPTERWRELFYKAVKILDLNGIARDEWTFGGGTALQLFYNHRESYDIDIFFHDVQLMSMISPRVNASTEKDVSDYTEAANFLKLKYRNGEIDFIIAPFLTREPWMSMYVEGEKIRVETPEEIVFKKLFYRAETLKVRDVIDLAVVYASRKQKLLQQIQVLSAKSVALKRRWQRLKPVFQLEAEGLAMKKEELVKNAPVLFEQFLNKLQ